MRIVKTRFVLLFFVVFATSLAHGQQCPEANDNGPDVPSSVLRLTGQLIYHDGLRKWFELKLDQVQCGAASIQLTSHGINWEDQQLEVLRGCRVISDGPLDFSRTGYWSLGINQDVQHIEPVGTCQRKPPLPDYSKLKPNKNINEYRVDMYVKFVSGDHPIRFRVTSAGKELRPWQAYASYYLTALFVLYGDCGKGFAAKKAFGARQANPEVTDGVAAAFDPESAAAHSKTDLHLGYICVREPYQAVEK